MRRLLRVTLLALVAMACRRAGDPIREAIDSAVRAASHRDAEGVVGHLSADYRGADGADRTETSAMVRRILAGYQSLDIQLSDVSIEPGEGAALARFRVHFSGTPSNIGGLSGLLPRSSSYRFEVRLVPDGRDWKIVWAQWAEGD